MPAAHRALAVDGQEADAGSTLNVTRALLALRCRTPALRHGAAAPLDLPAPLFGFVREAAGQRVTLLFNLAAGEVALPPGLVAGLGGLGGFGVADGTLPGYGFALLVPAEAPTPACVN
ncbi:MAG: DUF3459 domain-containing protein [Paracraurococcus sp.]